MGDNRVEEAIALIKAGRRSEAGAILEAEVRADPYNVRAWLWLTETRGPISEKILIVEACLRHNPNADIAAKALGQLKAQAKNGQNTAAQPAKPAAQSAPQSVRPAAQSAPLAAPPANFTAQFAQPTAQPASFTAQPAQPAIQPAKPKAPPAAKPAKPAKPKAQPVKAAHGPKDTYKGEHFMVEAYDDCHRFYFPVKIEAGMVAFFGLTTMFLCAAPLGIMATPQQDALAMCCLASILAGLGALAAMELLWQFVGEDVLEVSDSGVRLKHSLAGIGPSRRYPAEAVRQFALVERPKSQSGVWIISILVTVVSLILGGRMAMVPRFYPRFYNFKRGRLAVVFMKRNGHEEVCLFGSGLTGVEADQVLDLIDDLYPRLGGR